MAFAVKPAAEPKRAKKGVSKEARQPGRTAQRQVHSHDTPVQEAVIKHVIVIIVVVVNYG